MSSSRRNNVSAKGKTEKRSYGEKSKNMNSATRLMQEQKADAGDIQSPSVIAARQVLEDCEDAADGWMLPNPPAASRNKIDQKATKNESSKKKSGEISNETRAVKTRGKTKSPLTERDTNSPISTAQSVEADVEADATSLSRMYACDTKMPPTNYDNNNNVSWSESVNTTFYDMDEAIAESETATTCSSPSVDYDKPFTRMIMNGKDSPTTQKEIKLALIAAEEEVHSLRAHTATMAVDIQFMQQNIDSLTSRCEDLRNKLIFSNGERDKLIIQVASLVDQITSLEKERELDAKLKASLVEEKSSEVCNDIERKDEETLFRMNQKLAEANADCVVLRSIIMAAMKPSDSPKSAQKSQIEDVMSKVMTTPEAKNVAKESFYHLLEQNEGYRNEISKLEARISELTSAPLPSENNGGKERLADNDTDDYCNGNGDINNSLSYDSETDIMLTETEKRLALLQARMEQLSFIVSN